MNLNTVTGKEIFGVKPCPSKKVLDAIGWDEVNRIAKFIIPLVDFPDVEDIKKDNTKLNYKGIYYGDDTIVAVPFINVCGKSIILMWEYERARRVIKDGFHRMR